MYQRYLLFFLSFLYSLTTFADEGMWMLSNLNKQTRREMKALGLRMPVDKIYSEKRASLKDAVVSFGGFCSGVVVSNEGLVFTNHHCGYSCIQQHSTVEHDYLKDGFVAHSYEEELPNPDLYVRFLLRQEDVTARFLNVLTPEMDESTRNGIIDSLRYAIVDEVLAEDSTLVGQVDAYYGGNEFWLSVYQDYNDVRLVFAPPSSVGKFGWDTDNWEWPRHTGDFSVFRIYAGKDNKPADYSSDNVPYKPKYVAPVSLGGYEEGSFCMTLGYPGSTERYLSSFGIEEMVHNQNQAQIDVRGVKQAIWKREMDKRDSIRIKYASKYAESSNYWKNSIGVNRAIEKLRVIEKKQAMEQELSRWIREKSQNASSNGKDNQQLDAGALPLFIDLELNYKNRRAANHAFAYFVETFFYGPELVQQAWRILNFDFGADEKKVLSGLNDIVERYDNMDIEMDKEVCVALLREYASKVDSVYLPEVYHHIATAYEGDVQAYVDYLYDQTELATVRGLRRFVENDSTYQIYDDPAMILSFDLLTKLFEMNAQMQQSTQKIEQGERLLNKLVRQMYAERNFYPDANSTMRVSFGTVCSYEPFDGAVYDYRTTTAGVLQKVKAHAGNVDFAVQPEILELLITRNFGKYTDEKGEMNVCFISNNDITGGNSGSAMFNAKGQLLGLAFDGNWEAMSGDILYEPKMQRCIGVDVRYMLFIMEKWGKATRLIEELKLMK